MRLALFDIRRNTSPRGNPQAAFARALRETFDTTARSVAFASRHDDPQCVAGDHEDGGSPMR